jgi:hypothetical protein
MPIQGPRNNPFQLPQFGQPPAQQQNPFGQLPRRTGGNPAFTGQPPLDNFGQFKAQMENRSINPDITRPQPPQGAGQQLFAMG